MNTYIFIPLTFDGFEIDRTTIEATNRKEALQTVRDIRSFLNLKYKFSLKKLKP